MKAVSLAVLLLCGCSDDREAWRQKGENTAALVLDLCGADCTPDEARRWCEILGTKC